MQMLVGCVLAGFDAEGDRVSTAGTPTAEPSFVSGCSSRPSNGTDKRRFGTDGGFEIARLPARKQRCLPDR